MGIDVEAAARRYAQALRLTVDGDAERPRVLARTAEALRQRGRFAEAAVAYDEAIEGFRVQGDVRALGVAIGRRWNLLVRLGAPRDQQLEAEAVAALEPLGPTPELAQAITERAGQCFVANEYREAIAFADRAISLATELGLPEPARALGFRGAARAWLGDAGGLEAMRQALDAAAGQGLGREMALLYNNIHVALWPIEGVRRYLEVAQEGGAFAERRGIEEFAFSFASSTVVALTEYGSYHEARAMARDLAPRLEAADDMWELVQVRAAEIRVMTRQGDLAEADVARRLGDGESPGISPRLDTGPGPPGRRCPPSCRGRHRRCPGDPGRGRAASRTRGRSRTMPRTFPTRSVRRCSPGTRTSPAASSRAWTRSTRCMSTP